MVCYNIVCYTFSVTPHSTNKPSPVTSAAVGAFASISHGFYQLLKKSNMCCFRGYTITMGLLYISMNKYNRIRSSRTITMLVREKIISYPSVGTYKHEVTVKAFKMRTFFS